MKVDTEYLVKERARLGKKILEAEERLREHDVWKLWRKHFGSEAALSKRRQLGHILFEVLGYECRERTAPTPSHPKGQPKVDETAFESISLMMEGKEDLTVDFLKDFVRREKDIKADGTFLHGIQEETCDGFLHGNFNLNIPESFRSSADNPNTQNWPIRDKEQGKIIRQCFIPRGKDRHILEIDFFGNEIKSSYCYHKDPTYFHDITTGDMHRDTAAEIFFLKKKDVVKEQRQAAKNKFVFPQFFGDYYINCAQGLWEEIIRTKLNVNGVEMREWLKSKGIKKLGSLDPKDQIVPGTFTAHIKKIEDSFWNNRFKVYTAWKNEWWEQYVRRGWCRMLTGFVVQGPYNRKQVINYPIQGAAFHWLLWSLVEIDKYLRKHKMKSLIINQIHDSLIFDAHKDELDHLIEISVKIMTKLITKYFTWICVPMDVEVEVAPLGLSWHAKEKRKHG